MDKVELDYIAVRVISYKAAWLLSKGFPCSKEVAMAKDRACDTYYRVADLWHQIHTGLGIVLGHDLPLYSHGSMVVRQFYGNV